MPRTVDSIVACHVRADALRRAGKPVWNGTLMFQHRLTPLLVAYRDGTDLKPQELLDAFHAAAKEVRERIPQAKGDIVSIDDEDLEAFVLELEGFTLKKLEESPDILDEYETVLDRMFDWCDANRWFIDPA